MNKKIRKQCCGYDYSCKGEDWSVTTDYVNYKIYLSSPTDDEDIEAVENFGRAINKAVADMKKDTK